MDRVLVRFEMSPAIGVVEVGIKIPEEKKERVFFSQIKGRGEVAEERIKTTLEEVEELGLSDNVRAWVCHHLDQARAHQREWDRGRSKRRKRGSDDE